MRITFFSVLILAVIALFCGTLMFATGFATEVASGSDEPWNPCDENLMVGLEDWAVFHVWCFKTSASTDIDTFAKDDILRMEAQCPGTRFIKGEAIQRKGPDAILYRTDPNSKFGPIFVAYFESHCGIVREICRASNEEAGRHAYSNFLRNVVGDYGICIK